MCSDFFAGTCTTIKWIVTKCNILKNVNPPVKYSFSHLNSSPMTIFHLKQGGKYDNTSESHLIVPEVLSMSPLQC